MKKLLLPLFVLGLVYSCSNSSAADPKADSTANEAVQYFGDTITPDGAIAASEIMTKIAGKDSMAIKLEGKVIQACQKKGCWMEMDLGNDKTMRVTFKDYGFFVPKDCGGKTAVIDGFAHLDTTSVAELRHYAEDAGDSKEEIAKITEPEIELSFEARGVILRNK
jgi:Domain of unknown function (DUF4920)